MRPFALKGEYLEVLDQRKVPEEVWVRINDAFEGGDAISNMLIRGAPIIGIFAAYCLYIHYLKHPETIKEAWLYLKGSRPTGINLHNVLNEIKPLIDKKPPPGKLLEFARFVENREKEINLRIAEYGLTFFDTPKTVLTYCNTGSLATAEPGTALGIIKTAFKSGLVRTVYVGETSPYMQGARLTAYELRKEGIPYKVVPDNHLPFLISQGKVDLAIVGADRITEDKYVFNKIGTLSIALACRRFGIPFIVAAPSTTFDKNRFSPDITVEKRNDVPREDYEYYAFDITPPDLISFIVSEKGIWKAG